MKIISKLVSIILLLVMCLMFYSYKFAAAELYMGKHFLDAKEFAYFSLEILYIGFCIAYFWFLPSRIENKKRIKEYQNKLEKTSVNAETESSKVEILEAKIQSLEKALQSTLEKNNE